MKLKLLEIRDRGTFIPALAIQVSGDDGYLMRRAGFNAPMVYLIQLATERCRYDPYHWDNGRTLGNAHLYIQDHFDALTDGQVIDVEYLLGERPTPKRSEAETVP